ncbi:MAG: response regulator [Planctomycetes bacterium]|nr:response regulator [Planctomycetota bacterium]
MPNPEPDAPCILLVDDEEAILQVLHGALTASGLAKEIAMAKNAREALGWLRQRAWKADLVVSDLSMPGLSGEDLLAEIKANAPDLPVIVLTAHSLDERIIRCLERGASDFLVKPVPLKLFTQTVSAILERRAESRGGGGAMRVSLPVSGWIELTATSHIEYVERFRRFTELLYGTRLAEDAKFQLRMAIDEIGRNAVEWGNRESRTKRIQLTYAFFDSQIVIKIEDDGKGFDTSALQDPTRDPLMHLQDREAQGKRPGGFGVFLIRKLMDDVIYNERGNVVVMTKRLPGLPAEEPPGAKPQAKAPGGS